MIIIDFSQIFLSNLLKQAGKYADSIEPEMVRHMVLNSIRSYRQKYIAEYGEILIACDSNQYWRKEKFPQYKAHRKAEREKTKLDWNHIYSLLDDTREDLIKYFPYPVVRVDHCEADDVIAILAKMVSKTEKVMILSGDHDFAQLQKYPNIEQYDPIRKRAVKSNDPQTDLYTHIIAGDKGDGVPNILSKDNTYTDKIRATALKETKLSELLNSPALYFDPAQVLEGEQLRNFQRNRLLVDLDMIPENVANNIITEYNRVIANPNSRSKIMSYMIKHKMKNLIGSINDF